MQDSNLSGLKPTYSQEEVMQIKEGSHRPFGNGGAVCQRLCLQLEPQHNEIIQ